jgi:exodeoxyribonuclease V alpha subunit
MSSVMETFTGTVERITYYNEDNGYGVIKITPDTRMPTVTARDGTVTVVGVMPELGVGESAQFTGTWIDDPRYGKQMRIETVTPIVPTSLDGIKRYLASGIVKGIGERRAEQIVDHFGLKTLDILNREPHRIAEIPGIKPSLAESLARAWAENYAVRSTMIFLQGYGVTSRMAARIHQQFGSDTIERVQNDPYSLADEVYGIGFLKADQIARNMGIEPESPKRVRAGLLFTLNKLSTDGHTYAPHHLLIDTAVELLQVADRDLINHVLGEMLLKKQLVTEVLPGYDGSKASAIYLPAYHLAEVESAEMLRRMADTSSKITKRAEKITWAEFLEEIARSNSVSLTPQQQSAVRSAFTSKVSVLTGGPGTGKTTTLQMVIAALEEQDFVYALASPTGRAAKRLSEATDRGAMTIHRLLGYTPSEGFMHNEDQPLKVDMLIVDESSMIDLQLFYNLLLALKPTTHLMLVGDVEQLPSVGAGNVLRDVIESGLAHVTRLKTIFRQTETSHIVVNAHRVNEGDMPYTDNKSDDFYFFGEEDPARAAELVVDLVGTRLPGRFDHRPIEDIQVIAPMYRGPIGVDALNTALQEALNPGSYERAEKKQAGRVFRVGDKVMQTRNNYDKDVFNGDIGRVYGIELDDNTVAVMFDGRLIYYGGNELEELVHAYCISTHRSQGSEYPVIVMPVMTQHYMMLQRNLLYTAITRAKKMVVIVGSRRAVAMAVKNNKVAERYSGLLTRLQAK